jgi:hypothetical protein
MTNPQPTNEAVARIHALGEKAICEFLDEVSLGSIQSLTPLLPFVPGFRRTSQAGILQEKRTLVRRFLASPAEWSISHQREYRALYYIWRAWALEKLGDSETVDGLLDKIEEFEDGRSSVDGGKSQAENVEIEKLFAGLRELSRDNKCSREQIERLFTFSPFSKTPSIAGLIDGSKDAAAVGREAVYTAMPQRVQQVEQEIQSIKAQIRSIIVRIDAIASALEPLQSHEGKINALIEAERALRKLVTIEHETKLKSLGDADEVIRRTVAANTKELKRIVALIDDHAQIVSDFEKQITQRFAVFADDIQAVRKLVEGLTTTIPTREWCVEIENRLSAAEILLSEQPPPAPVGAPPPSTSQPVVALQRPGPRVERVANTGTAGSTQLLAPKDVASAISSNLQIIGLKKTAALTFAEEITAAVLAGQIVFFKGAFSTEVARLCAISVAGGDSFRVSVPIGLDDGECLRAAIAEAVGSSALGISAVAMEGVNRSAIELFEDALLDLSSGPHARPFVAKGYSCIFASVLQGPASLPIDPNYLELGPMFYLDYLDWRPALPAKSATILGTISPKQFDEMRGLITGAAAEDEEPLRLLRKHSPKKTPRLERTVLAAYRALHAFKRSVPGPSALQSLAYGWLLPLWIAQGRSKEDADSELDAGKCDAGAVDQRLASMASDELPSQSRGQS